MRLGLLGPHSPSVSSIRHAVFLGLIIPLAAVRVRLRGGRTPDRTQSISGHANGRPTGQRSPGHTEGERGPGLDPSEDHLRSQYRSPGQEPGRHRAGGLRADQGPQRIPGRVEDAPLRPAPSATRPGGSACRSTISSPSSVPSRSSARSGPTTSAPRTSPRSSPTSRPGSQQAGGGEAAAQAPRRLDGQARGYPGRRARAEPGPRRSRADAGPAPLPREPQPT